MYLPAVSVETVIVKFGEAPTTYNQTDREREKRMPPHYRLIRWVFMVFEHIFQWSNASTYFVIWFMNPKDVWRWIANDITRKHNICTIIGFLWLWPCFEHRPIYKNKPQKRKIEISIDTIELDWNRLSARLIKIDIKNTILTANVERFALFTLADCIMYFTFDHAIVKLSCNVRYYLQMESKNYIQNRIKAKFLSKSKTKKMVMHSRVTAF